MAVQLDQAGADGLVLFNRFYQPDIDPETEQVIPSLELSGVSDLRLRLRWVGILVQYVQADLAVTGGVHSGLDVLKCVLAGARVAEVASAWFRSLAMGTVSRCSSRVGPSYHFMAALL